MNTNTEYISFKYLWFCFALLIFLSGITTKPAKGKSSQSKFECCCADISWENELFNLLNNNSHDSKSNPSESREESSVELEEEVDDCQFFRGYNINFMLHRFSVFFATDFKNQRTIMFHPEKDSPPPQG
jgi:hypothetical protein